MQDHHNLFNNLTNFQKEEVRKAVRSNFKTLLERKLKLAATKEGAVVTMSDIVAQVDRYLKNFGNRDLDFFSNSLSKWLKSMPKDIRTNIIVAHANLIEKSPPGPLDLYIFEKSELAYADKRSVRAQFKVNAQSYFKKDVAKLDELPSFARNFIIKTYRKDAFFHCLLNVQKHNFLNPLGDL